MKLHVFFFNIHQNNLLVTYLFFVTFISSLQLATYEKFMGLENAFFVTWNIGKCL